MNNLAPETPILISSPERTGGLATLEPAHWPPELPAALRMALDYWNGLSHDGIRPPTFRDIDLMELYPIADRLVVVDMVGGAGADGYFWRYAGTHLRNIWGLELTGKLLSETHDASTAEGMVRCFQWIAETGQPRYCNRPAGVTDHYKGHILFERIMLPLTGADGRIGHLLGCYEFGFSRT